MSRSRHHLAALESQVVSDVAAAWTRNWLPSEVVRVADQLGSRLGGDLAAIAIGVERRTNPAMASPHWLAELDDVAARCDVRSFELYAEHVDAQGGFLAEVETAAERLLAVVTSLPAMTKIAARPGTTMTRVEAGDAGPSAKLLEKVRALLAKAEGTTFPDQAEAFTAKAHQLMSEHSIAEAMLADPDGTAPAAIRLWHDRPYVKSKSVLLSCVARAAGGRTVFHPGFGVSTVFGFSSDLDAIELLFTSLLLQASTELAELEQAWSDDPRRIKSFRNSFLVGYGHRVGQRLQAVRADVARHAASSNDAVLPVLASREADVERAVDEAFSQLRPMRTASSNGAGYFAGTIAADRADLGPGGHRLAR